eukprot:6696845-Ditylum_brightwellii.AAC.1
MRLDLSNKGGPPKFFFTFQNVYLDLEYFTGKTAPDEEKIGALNASMDDSCVSSICTTIETLALQTKTLIDYASYLQSLITFAENLKPGTSRTCESNKLQKTGGERDGGKGSEKDKSWQNDYSAWVPKDEFCKLPREEREKQMKVRVEAKRTRETQALQMNSLQNTQPQ